MSYNIANAIRYIGKKKNYGSERVKTRAWEFLVWLAKSVEKMGADKV